MNRFFHCLPALTLAAFVSACCPCMQVPPQTVVKTAPVLSANSPKAGDIVDVSIEGQKDLSGAYTVGPDGNITMPLVGKVAVAGQPKSALAGVIGDAYRAGYLVDPTVSAEVISK